MLFKTMRRCFAASAIGLAGALGSGTAWAESHIRIVLEDPIALKDDGSIDDGTFDGFISEFTRNGLAYGTALTVEWWEGNNGSATRNDDCTFTIGVSKDGYYFDSGYVEYERLPFNRHKYKLSDGCNPEKVKATNSFMRIYPSDPDGIFDVKVPLVLNEIAVNSGKNVKKRNFFGAARQADRGTAANWSISDDCFPEAFLMANTSLATVSDGPNDFAQLNVNADPKLYEGGDAGDVSNEGGVLIFPSRTWGDQIALTLCDSGYLNNLGAKFPDPNADYNISYPAMFSSLPHSRFANGNLTGNGLKESDFRGQNRNIAIDDKDVLSVLTYNIYSIPDKPKNAGKCFFAWPGGGWSSNNAIGRACDSRVGYRTRRLREIAESVRSVQPDVVVFLEAFQNHFSGYGLNRWGADSARRALKNDLNDLYDFKSVGPSGGRNFGGNPTSCNPGGETTRLSQDSDVYPDQTYADMSHDHYCSSIKRNSLDSGVLIGVRRASAGVDHDAFKHFDDADGVDKGSSKGIKYVKLTKGGQSYHVFGTHLQSSKDQCAARITQLRAIRRFISTKTNVEDDADERIILTGDLNIDPILNNHQRRNENVGKTCRNELEYLVQTLRTMTANVDDRVTAGRVHLSPYSMPFSNDCLLNRKVISTAEDERCGRAEAPGNKSKLLDHVIWLGAKPKRSGSTYYRQTADGEDHNLEFLEDLSGHYPMLSVLDYRENPDNRLWPWYEYGDTKYTGRDDDYIASIDYNRPTTCPYGTIVEYVPSGGSLASSDYLEPELVCLPAHCYGSTNSASGNVCNPATHAGIGAVRKYCRETDSNGKNHAAPCIVPAGYQNLAKMEGVQISASGSWNNSHPAHVPKFVTDGKVLFSSDTTAHGYRVWAGPAREDGHWIQLKWPRAQYVKRIRFRNSGNDSHSLNSRAWASKTYSLFYQDAFGITDGCSDTDSINTLRGNPGLTCPKYFDMTASMPTATLTVENKSIPNPDVWHVHELTKPVLTDSIIFQCDSSWTNGKTGGCGLAEIEVYGGAE
ncbi:MAG: hypothetical protein AAGL90_15280 [Pseudomonadota bacterium]